MSKLTDNENFVTDLQSDLHARGLYSGTVDGWAGKLTREAFNKLIGGKPLPAATSPQPSSKLYVHALKDEGLKETPGSGSTPRIRRAILEAASWLNPDDSVTAWCGCIMGLWFSEVGLVPPAAYYRAASWLNIGKAVQLSEAKPGDIVVLSRSGGNHVGLYVSHDGSHITLLGGNQGNAVNRTRYPLSSLKGIRRA